MKKLTISAVLLTGVLIGGDIRSGEAEAATVEKLSCEAGLGPVPTSFVLYRKQPGEPSFTVAEEQPKCEFVNLVVPDGGATCFYFAAKNVGGEAKRGWTTICYDPTLLPVAPPVVLEVK